ncbi:MAG: flotillin-like FloA family protein, partial [Phycisphaerales bacterium]
MNSFIAAVSGWTIGGIIIGGIILLIFVGTMFKYAGLYLQAWVSGAKVGFVDLVMMQFRKVNAKSVVINRISAKKAGLEVSTDQLEAHLL